MTTSPYAGGIPRRQHKHPRTGPAYQTVTDITLCADSYVHLRLARLEMVRHGRRGWGWTTHYRLPWLRAIGVHRLPGTVLWGATHAAQ